MQVLLKTLFTAQIWQLNPGVRNPDVLSILLSPTVVAGSLFGVLAESKNGRSTNGRFLSYFITVWSLGRLTLYEASHQTRSAKAKLLDPTAVKMHGYGKLSGWPTYGADRRDHRPQNCTNHSKKSRLVIDSYSAPRSPVEIFAASATSSPGPKSETGFSFRRNHQSNRNNGTSERTKNKGPPRR